MKIQVNSPRSIAIYFADPRLREPLFGQIERQCAGFEDTFEAVADLDSVLHDRGVQLLLAALSEEGVRQSKGDIGSKGQTGKGVEKQRGFGGTDDGEFAGVLGFLERLHQRRSELHVILLTPLGLTIEQSREFITAGISGIVNYHEADFGERLAAQIDTVLQRVEGGRAKQRAAKGQGGPASKGIVGGSDVLKRLLEQSRRAARVSDVPILILGESGTGKQRIAEFIHQLDRKRSQHAFVTVNCAAIVGSLAESELFGHQKGAFTGATQNRLGYFRTADGGTILLDEISELDLSLQPKILRVLQEALIRPVGSDKEYSIDVRIIAATHRDLARRVKGGEFRLDLYQRLKVIELRVPPLRERLEDIPVLFEAFLKKYSSYYPYEVREVDPGVYDILGQTIGAGNIRELENIVRQTLVFKEGGGRIEVKDLPAALMAAVAMPDEGAVDIEIPRSTIEALAVGRKRLSEAMDEYERVILNRLVTRDISQTALADRLGITRRTLYNKLQKYKLRG